MAVPPDQRAHLRAWGLLWSVPDLPDRVHVSFSGRLRRALGRCTPTTGSIRLHPGLLDAGPEILREVLCHEAAHVAAHLLYGRRAPHGREWAALMEAAGYEPRVRWHDERLPESMRTPPRRRGARGKVWEHRCRHCGAFATARRPMRTWRCRRCRAEGRTGLLEIAFRVLGVGPGE